MCRVVVRGLYIGDIRGSQIHRLHHEVTGVQLLLLLLLYPPLSCRIRIDWLPLPSPPPPDLPLFSRSLFPSPPPPRPPETNTL